jgi:hypothetical protein
MNSFDFRGDRLSRVTECPSSVRYARHLQGIDMGEVNDVYSV